MDVEETETGKGDLEPCKDNAGTDTDDLKLCRKQEQCGNRAGFKSFRICFVSFHKSLFEILADQKIFIILLRHLFTTVCMVLALFFVTTQLSHPYNSTGLMLLLKILILVFLLICVDVQVLFNIRKTCLAFFTLFCISSSDPPFSFTMLPK